MKTKEAANKSHQGYVILMLYYKQKYGTKKLFAKNTCIYVHEL